MGVDPIWQVISGKYKPLNLPQYQEMNKKDIADKIAEYIKQQAKDKQQWK